MKEREERERQKNMPIPPAPAPLVNDEFTTYAKEDEDFGQVFSKKKKSCKTRKGCQHPIKSILKAFLINLISFY